LYFEAFSRCLRDEPSTAPEVNQGRDAANGERTANSDVVANPHVNRKSALIDEVGNVSLNRVVTGSLLILLDYFECIVSSIH
jgi:hypothetical protein